MLGGRPPRRGGRLTNPGRERRAAPEHASQILSMTMIGALIIGVVAGFAFRMDRQIRGGILQQRAEALDRPDWVSLDDLPRHVAAAFRIVLDPGTDLQKIVRGGYGNSGITYELVRDVHMLGKGLRAEARELAMAPALERHLDERELFEFYLNRIALGTIDDYPIFGLYHAAVEYLAKAPVDLTLSEAATLAGILLAPRIERPDAVPGAMGIRRNEVLSALLAVGEITQEEYEQAIAEPLGFQPGLTEIPMSRRLPSPEDTVVIRLPEEYRPQPDTVTVAEP